MLNTFQPSLAHWLIRSRRSFSVAPNSTVLYSVAVEELSASEGVDSGVEQPPRRTALAAATPKRIVFMHN